MRYNLFFLLLIAATVTTACASSGSKIQRNLLISSEPAGATVYLDGDKVGETPLKTQAFFSWNSERPYDSLLRRIIYVSKDGYVPQSRDLFATDMPNMTFFLIQDNSHATSKGGTK